jgi:hypothetical protein
MHKVLIYLAIYFCLTCFGLSFRPSSEAGVQFWQWSNPSDYGFSARAAAWWDNIPTITPPVTIYGPHPSLLPTTFGTYVSRSCLNPWLWHFKVPKHVSEYWVPIHWIVNVFVGFHSPVFSIIYNKFNYLCWMADPHFSQRSQTSLVGFVVH